MQQLLEVSKQPALPDKGQNMTKLPQVHAMNCLKDIFTSTKLKQCTEAFVMPALVMSAECLDSAMQVVSTTAVGRPLADDMKIVGQ